MSKKKKREVLKLVGVIMLILCASVVLMGQAGNQECCPPEGECTREEKFILIDCDEATGTAKCLYKIYSCGEFLYEEWKACSQYDHLCAPGAKP